MGGPFKTPDSFKVFRLFVGAREQRFFTFGRYEFRRYSLTFYAIYRPSICVRDVKRDCFFFQPFRPN